MPEYKRTFLEQINSFPPFAVYAAAKIGYRPRRNQYRELIARSGLSEATFIRIAKQINWDNVKAWQIEAFCKACNMDLLHQRQRRTFLKGTLQRERPMVHLLPRQLRRFEEKCELWQSKKAPVEEQPTQEPQPH